MCVGATEIMTPFGDAMCFINRDTGQLALGINSLKAATEGLAERIFGGNVEEARARVTYQERMNKNPYNAETVQIPQQRSFMISFRSPKGVFEFRVATGILAASRAATWLFIRARSGDMTMVMP